MKADQDPLYLPKLPECATPKVTSDFMFCLQVTRDLESIDHLCIQDRINTQVI